MYDLTCMWNLKKSDSKNLVVARGGWGVAGGEDEMGERGQREQISRYKINKS